MYAAKNGLGGSAQDFVPGWGKPQVRHCWSIGAFLRCTFLLRPTRFFLGDIGVGAGKLWGCEGFLPKFLQICPKSFCATLPTNFLPQRSWRPFFDETSKKKSSCVFRLCAIFWIQSWAPFFPDFAKIFRDFSQIFRDFVQTFRDFQQIKTFGGAFAPCTSASYTTAW